MMVELTEVGVEVLVVRAVAALVNVAVVVASFKNKRNSGRYNGKFGGI